jgi:hypothetical protein
MSSVAQIAGFQGAGQPVAQPMYLVDQYGNPLGSSQAQPIPVSQIVGGSPISATNPEINISNIQALILAGKAFRATTGLVTTGAASTYIGLQAIVNNIAKSVIIYRLEILSGSAANSGDLRLYTNNAATADSFLTASLLSSVRNQQPANMTNTSLLSALNGSPSGTLQTGGFVGMQVAQAGVSPNGVFDFLQGVSWIYFAPGDIGSVAAYIKVATSGNAAALSMEWVEF